MKWLDRLKKDKAPNTHAREPRQPPEVRGPEGFLGLQAYPWAPFQKIGAMGQRVETHPAMAANDGATPDPDRWCYPHTQAMNTREIDTFTARLGMFTDKGVSYDDAERLADALLIRDRDGDNRRPCLECTHLQGAGRWRCGNWQAADVACDGLARDVVLILQRCSGFAGWQGLIERRTNDQA